MKKIIKYILIFVSVFLINSKVLALTEKYEIINSKGWGETTEVNIANTLDGKKATEYIVSYPTGSSYNMESNSNPLCVYPINHSAGNYTYFPLSNSCKTTISYSGLTKGSTSSKFIFNVSVNSQLPTLKKCTDEQFKSLNFSDTENSLCYYCDSHQCLGDINAKPTTKEVGIIYKEANKHLKIQFESSFGNIIYQSKDKYKDVLKGPVDSVKSLKDDDKRAIMIKLNGQTGKLPYLAYYNQDTIAGAGVINIENSEENTITTLSKSCTDEQISNIKKIDGVGSKIECYYCNQITCQGNINVDTDVDTVALFYRNAYKTLKISFEDFEGTSFFQSKNAWKEINYYSINSIYGYGTKNDQAILLNLTGKDGTLEYKVKYNDNSEAGSGSIIIGTGINPENGQDGSSYNKGTEVTDCEVVPSVVKKWIKVALNFVKYVALVLVIVLGTIDFIKAAASGEPDAMKKAGQSFVKRVVAVIILFLLPMIVDLLLNLIDLFGANTDCFGVLE